MSIKNINSLNKSNYHFGDLPDSIENDDFWRSSEKEDWQTMSNHSVSTPVKTKNRVYDWGGVDLKNLSGKTPSLSSDMSGNSDLYVSRLNDERFNSFKQNNNLRISIPEREDLFRMPRRVRLEQLSEIHGKQPTRTRRTRISPRSYFPFVPSSVYSSPISKTGSEFFDDSDES